MFLPYQVDVPMQRLPLVNWSLIAVTIVLSFMAFASERMLMDWVLWRDESFRLTQLLTNFFIHLDIVHLVGNMLFLFVFGNAINAKLGHVQYILLYAALGLFSSATWYITGPGTASLGASGAIMGIVGTFLVLYPRNDIACFYWFGIFRSGVFRVSSYWIILLYVLLDVWGLTREGSGTNYVAHVSGAASGLLIGVGLILIGVVRSEPEEQNLLEAFGWTPGRRPARRIEAKPTAKPARGSSGAAPAGTVRRKFKITASDRTTGFQTCFVVEAGSIEEVRHMPLRDDLVLRRVDPL